MDKLWTPLFRRIDELLRIKKQIIVAVDGNSAAGKSSLAALLKSVYSCNTFSMDDFFLQPFQRTPQRLNEPGGNIDYERFTDEIIKPLRSGQPFSYRPYSCKTGKLSEPIAVNPNRLNVIEGVYCLHPCFSEIYDLKVFLSLDSDEQLIRLSKRDSELYNRFVREWIPTENKYFEFYQISAKCDLIFRMGSYSVISDQ